ncbi:MAG: hypothetical protein AABX14_05900 [Candidatus Aenigmatarchaeota archaeon]
MDITKTQEQLTAHCPHLYLPNFDTPFHYELEDAELVLNPGNFIRVKYVFENGSSESNPECSYLRNRVGEGPPICCPRYLENVPTCPLRELR